MVLSIYHISPLNVEPKKNINKLNTSEVEMLLHARDMCDIITDAVCTINKYNPYTLGTYNWSPVINPVVDGP